MSEKTDPEFVIPEPWMPALRGELDKPYWSELQRFLRAERAEHTVFPPAADVLSALAHTPFDAVRVVILGQDPYHDDGQAHGLSFSVRPGVTPPPSLVNIFKELESDLGIKVPKKNGCLVPWADRGVLLLNAVLTVRAHEPASHKGKGWETFTDAVLRALDARPGPLALVLWGAHAQKKAKLFDKKRHAVIESAHPSPLSARAGFFGSKPFSRVNEALVRFGSAPIDWTLP